MVSVILIIKMNKELIHYSKEPFELEIITDYPQRGDLKPNGFWVSIENKDKNFFDWEDWCQEEEFYLEGLRHKYSIKLSENSNILELTSNEDMHVFQKTYMTTDKPYKFSHISLKDIEIIQWDKIADSYQGVFIYPYHHSFRKSNGFGWYYGWDCSSGCIWDLSIVESINKIEEERKWIQKNGYINP